MAHVSHKLSNSVEGALAGGGDPATSPLYVFGPFLRLIVVAGVAPITFGASIWLVVITVIAVSAMYRRVMIWVTDGSGGSGLCEEELGPWAVKVNASITFVEYTLTFLVSIAALVTFLADRLPALQQSLVGIPYRTMIAVALSVATAALVNRGPKVAARAFGPATAAILLLLWVMIGATVWKTGFHLPGFDLRAFTPEYLEFTVGGYARILALMTGIEIFANLVSAYRGPARERSRMAFTSLVIIMGTTAATMVVVGPAILQFSDPTNPNVSVFTQAMDHLLPAPLPYVGTLIGVAVLLSAAAASAQGLQNLVLGLRYRHYIPAPIGRRNAFDVADKPVWIQVGIVCVCFFAFGTHEETYLALYAAGVFVLLSLTGWAAVKRQVRELRAALKVSGTLALAVTLIAALLTSAATVVIFYERFTEGAWTYLLMIPALVALLSYFRRGLGAPTPVENRLGLLIVGKGFLRPFELEPPQSFRRILVLLDGSMAAEQAIPSAQLLCRLTGADLLLVGSQESDGANLPITEVPNYLESTRAGLADASDAKVLVSRLPLGEAAAKAADASRDLIVCARAAGSPSHDARSLAILATEPVLFLTPGDNWKSRRARFSRILVAVDGSEPAEQVLAVVRAIAARFSSEIILTSVPEGSESETYEQTLVAYLARVAEALSKEGLQVRTLVATGPGPARALAATAQLQHVDLIALASHGRGGVERREFVKLGSVASHVLEHASCPVLIVPIDQPPSAAAPVAAVA